MFDNTLFVGDQISFTIKDKEYEGLVIEKDFCNGYTYLAVQDENDQCIEMSALRNIKILERGKAYKDAVQLPATTLKATQFYTKENDIKFNYSFGESVASVLEEWLPMLNKLANDYNERQGE